MQPYNKVMLPMLNKQEAVKSNNIAAAFLPVMHMHRSCLCRITRIRSVQKKAGV
jgi:hypothetical protein